MVKKKRYREDLEREPLAELKIVRLAPIVYGHDAHTYTTITG